MEAKKIGFIGAGNMAGALIKGLLGSKTVGARDIKASDVRADRLADSRAITAFRRKRTTRPCSHGPTSPCWR